MLKAEKISKKFQKEFAVKDLSFELKVGDITGLLGPNGAGKTTTMRMLTSFFFPTKGEITIDGKSTTQFTTETQKKIGYLPENNPLYGEMLTLEYLEMSAKIYKLGKNETINRIKEVSKQVTIEDKLLLPISQLSKGYKQRVGIAAAILHNPKIIILDEPTEGLDPNEREKIRKLIKDLSKNKAIMISTHVMQEVKAMCNKVIVINKGELVTQGEPDKLSKIRTIRLQIEGKNIESSLKKLLNEGEKIKISKKGAVETIEIMSNRELRPEISEEIAKNKWTLWELELEDSLEEVFHSLK